MEDNKHPLIEELSFEDITFGESADLNTPADDLESPVKRDLVIKKTSLLTAQLQSTSTSQSSASAVLLKKEKRSKGDKSDRHAVLISTKGDKINLAILLKQLEECGPVRAHHFRERQNFGFVQFLDSDSADNAIERLGNREIDGQIIAIERIKRITPGKDPRIATVGSPQCSSLPTTLPSMIENKPDSTLVLKNLPFNLRQVQLQEILENINPSAPQSVNFHYDSIGVFRGMAFVKYRLVEDAIKVFDALNGADVHGRRVRLEYKRKVSKSSEIPPEVLEDEKLKRVWEQLKEFKEDISLNAPAELTFASFTGVQRMYIHNMAEKLKLTHTSIGEEPNRSIIVTNKKPTVGTPSKDDMVAAFLSSSPAYLGVGGHMPAPLSTTPTNSYTSISSTPTQSMFINKAMDMPNSLGSHFLRSTPPNSNSMLSKTPTTPSLLISEANNKIGSSWDKSPTNNHLLTNPLFTTRGFGIVSRDRSFSTSAVSSSDIELSTSPVSSPVLRQPKGPDGTKGFSDGYRAARKLGPSPLTSPVHTFRVGTWEVCITPGSMGTLHFNPRCYVNGYDVESGKVFPGAPSRAAMATLTVVAFLFGFFFEEGRQS
eukprot:gene3785-4364_t